MWIYSSGEIIKDMVKNLKANGRQISGSISCSSEQTTTVYSFKTCNIKKKKVLKNGCRLKMLLDLTSVIIVPPYIEDWF